MIKFFFVEWRIFIRYPKDTSCHRCHQGKIITTDVDQHCNYCGRIFNHVPAIPFNMVRPGERFYSAYQPDELLVKMKEDDQRDHRRNNYYKLDKPSLQGSSGPTVPCIREGDRRMVMTDFSYN